VSGSSASVPIIIGGCHRSGTSLLRRLLNAHSRIYCAPEIKFFRDFYADYFHDPLAHLRFTASARSMLPEDQALAILGRAFVAMQEQAARNHGKPRWADKCPENVLYLEKWQQLLGDSWQFIHVLRHPLDVLASMEEARFDLTIPVELQARIDFYLRYTECGLRFAERHPGRSYRLWYEALVADPRAELERLMQWLGERCEPAQLAYNRAAVHQTGLEDPKVAKAEGVHEGSVGRWREILSAEAVSLARGRLGALWQRLCEDPRVPPPPGVLRSGW
jgi:hypothetical protein